RGNESPAPKPAGESSSLRGPSLHSFPNLLRRSFPLLGCVALVAVEDSGPALPITGVSLLVLLRLVVGINGHGDAVDDEDNAEQRKNNVNDLKGSCPARDAARQKKSEHCPQDAKRHDHQAANEAHGPCRQVTLAIAAHHHVLLALDLPFAVDAG